MRMSVEVARRLTRRTADIAEREDCAGTGDVGRCSQKGVSSRCVDVCMHTTRLLYHVCDETCFGELAVDALERLGDIRENEVPAISVAVRRDRTATTVETRIDCIQVARIHTDQFRGCNGSGEGERGRKSEKRC